jgi:TonB family protein
MPPTTTASTGTETNSTAAGTNFLQMLRDRLSNAIGTTGSSSGNVAGGTGGQMGLPGAVPNKQPSPSLGLGASSLGGLASRNLENGMATFFANTGKVDRPECLICSKPVYPERAQRSGVTGDVLVGYDLDKNGKVIGTHLLRSSGNAELDRASLAEARNHKFKPMENGYNGFVTRFSYRKGGTSSSVSASPRPAATAPNLLLSAPPKRSRPADGQTSVHELLPEPSPTDASEPPAPERSPAYTPSEPSSTPGVANLERERATAPATNLEIGASADSASPRSNSQ